MKVFLLIILMPLNSFADAPPHQWEGSVGFKFDWTGNDNYVGLNDANFITKTYDKR